MKKLTKVILLNQAQSLTKEEMKLIVGSSSYRCCCGSGSDIECFDVNGGDLRYISTYIISEACKSGGGCFMND